MDTSKKFRVPKSQFVNVDKKRKLDEMDTAKKSPIPKSPFVNVDKIRKLHKMKLFFPESKFVHVDQKQKLDEVDMTKKLLIPKSRFVTVDKIQRLHEIHTTKKSRIPKSQFVNVGNKQKLSMRIKNLRKARVFLFRKRLKDLKKVQPNLSTPQQEKPIQSSAKDSYVRRPKFNQLLRSQVEPLRHMDTTKKSPTPTSQFINVDNRENPSMLLKDPVKVRAHQPTPHTKQTQIVDVFKKQKLRTGEEPGSHILSGNVSQVRRNPKRTCTRPPLPRDSLKIPTRKYDSSKVPPYAYETGELPPHPQDSGKVSQVNICPECEAYTVKELERQGTSYPREEALRGRYMCGECQKTFDLGITMFDPRGWPGVTLYEGADLFQPPVAPLGKPPCPRCWANASVSFQCMTLYLREETRVPCQPACPAHRLLSEEELEREEDEECQTSSQIGVEKMSVQPTLDDRHTEHNSSDVGLPTSLKVNTTNTEEREYMKRLVWTVIGRDITKVD